MRLFANDVSHRSHSVPSTLRKMRKGWGTRSFRIAQTLVVAVLVCFSLGVTDTTNRFNKLGGKLMCTCGCAQMLLGCDHVGCPNRGDEMDRLRNGIAGGLTDAAILDGFVQEYGVVVLAAPPAEGFNLVAWIMPFAVSAIALIGTILLVRNWAKNRAMTAPAGNVQSPEATTEIQERIRRETGTESEV